MVFDFREHSSGALAGNDHCVTSVRIRSFYGPYFPGFWLNTEIRRHTKSLRIQSKCGKIRTRKTCKTDTFEVVELISIA